MSSSSARRMYSRLPVTAASIAFFGQPLLQPVELPADLGHDRGRPELSRGAFFGGHQRNLGELLGVRGDDEVCVPEQAVVALDAVAP